MTTARLFRPRSGVHGDPLARRLLTAYLVSLLLHGVALVMLTGGWFGEAPRSDKPPVYYVDLVNKPVLNPQAGRPEPRLPPAPPAPVAPVKSSVPSKPVPVAKVPAKAADRHVADALRKLRDEQTLQQRLAALRQGQTVPMDAPVGLPDARGNEAGVYSEIYILAVIQQNWALSPYSLADPARMAGIEAWVRITYSKAGRLQSFRFEKPSGDQQFDESIKRALIKSQQLPNALPIALEDKRVIFNLRELKALAEARR